MNYFVALFFLVDAIMKMIAQGVLLTPKGYFQVWPTANPPNPHSPLPPSVWNGCSAPCIAFTLVARCIRSL